MKTHIITATRHDGPQTWPAVGSRQDRRERKLIGQVEVTATSLHNEDEFTFHVDINQAADFCVGRKISISINPDE